MKECDYYYLPKAGLDDTAARSLIILFFLGHYSYSIKNIIICCLLFFFLLLGLFQLLDIKEEKNKIEREKEKEEKK